MIVCGIRPNEHAKDPIVYETVVDCICLTSICLTNAEQLGEDKHDLLGDGYFPIKYISEDIDPRVYYNGRTGTQSPQQVARLLATKYLHGGERRRPRQQFMGP